MGARRTYTRLVLVFTTSRSQYALDPARGLFLQFPGGTACGLAQGVWHRVAAARPPAPGERFFAFVTPMGGGSPLPIRTGNVTWVGTEPAVAPAGTPRAEAV